MTTKIAVRFGVGLLLWWLHASSARAELREGTWRGFLDVDVFSGGVVHEDPRGPAASQKFSVIGVGPNQLGSSRAVIGTPALGFGFDYALRARWLIGLRAGLGYDRVNNDDQPNVKVVSLSLMPALTFVPLGDWAKLFARVSPIMQYDRLKLGDMESHIFQGCFSIGVGSFMFLGRSSSVDVGGYFEGRFGDLKFSGIPGADSVGVNDLRGLIRVGLSIWR